MKKVFTLMLSGVIGITFAQNNLHEARVVGKFDLGNKEITAIFNEVTGCTHKTSPHDKGLFVEGEEVQLDIQNNRAEVIKPTLPKVVFADRGCSEVVTFRNDNGELQKSLSPTDRTMINAGDRVVADLKIGPGVFLWIVIPADGGDAYPYYGNPEIPLNVTLVEDYPDDQSIERRACGRVYCCKPGESAWAGEIPYCTGTGRDLR